MPDLQAQDHSCSRLASGGTVDLHGLGRSVDAIDDHRADRSWILDGPGEGGAVLPNCRNGNIGSHIIGILDAHGIQISLRLLLIAQKMGNQNLIGLGASDPVQAESGRQRHLRVRLPGSRPVDGDFPVAVHGQGR